MTHTDEKHLIVRGADEFRGSSRRLRNAGEPVEIKISIWSLRRNKDRNSVVRTYLKSLKFSAVYQACFVRPQGVG